LTEIETLDGELRFRFGEQPCALCSRTTKQASDSSTDQGGRKRPSLIWARNFIKRLRNCRTPDHNGWVDNEWTGSLVLIPDYVAIGFLVVLIVWAVADWLPRGKL
jgi:hypothetical protein